MGKAADTMLNNLHTLFIYNEHDLNRKDCKLYMVFVCTYKSAAAKMQETLERLAKAVYQFQDKVEKPSSFTGKVA